MPLSIIEKNAKWLVADKPSGQLVHPTRPGGPVTLLDELRGYHGYEIANGAQVSIINRLDRETSGAVLAALSSDAARALAIAMQERRIGKEYRAIVFGWPEWDERDVDAPLARRADHDAESPTWVEQIVHPAGAPCRTTFRVIRRFEKPGAGAGKFAEIQAVPHTGRMHQIRVHLKYLGFPVVGDKLYAAGPECYADFVENGWSHELENQLLLRRHALHSFALKVPEPGGMRRIECPLPEDMTGFLSGDG